MGVAVWLGHSRQLKQDNVDPWCGKGGGV